MTNTPRRKIYEKMLEYEEFVMEIQILARDKKSFEKYKTTYENSFSNAMDKYREIKALLMMFFENEEFASENDFNNKLEYYIINEKEVNAYLKKNKNIKNKFSLIVELDNIFEKNEKLETYKQTFSIFEKLDEFNSAIPKILEIRRDKM